MKNSVAIWADNNPQESDLHINYWVIKRKFFVRDHFLDIGVKLCKWQGGKVSFYFPYEITSDCICELGTELKNRELANALFNENCEITSGAGKKFEIKLPNETLTIFEFDVDNDVEFENKYSGTVISTNVPESKNNWYLRFRVKIRYRNALKKLICSNQWQTVRSIFSEKHTPRGSFYQSVRSSVDAVDFRINNKRDLNPSLLDENQGIFLNFRKLHFFLINDIDEDLISSTVKPRKVRLLENKIWKKYLHGVSGNRRKYCASHWHCKPQGEDGWEIFFKLQFGSTNLLTLALYLLIGCLIAGTVNVGAAFFYDAVKGSPFFSG